MEKVPYGEGSVLCRLYLQFDSFKLPVSQYLLPQLDQVCKKDVLRNNGNNNGRQIFGSFSFLFSAGFAGVDCKLFRDRGKLVFFF